MRPSRALALALLLPAAFAAGCCRRVAPLPASPRDAGRGAGEEERRSTGAPVVPGEYLVTLAPGAGAEVLEEALAGLPPHALRALAANLYLVAFRAEDPGLAALEARRAREPRLQAVQPNHVYRATR